MKIKEIITYLEDHAFISESAKEICVAALKKQEAKVTEYGSVWHCPECGVLHNANGTEQYCDVCGQKVAWAEQEE